MGKHSFVICSVCKTEMRSDTLKRHLEGSRCNQIVNRVSVCPYLECNVYTDRTNLRKHLNNHHPESKNINLKELRSLSKGKSTVIGEYASSEIKLGDINLGLFEYHEHSTTKVDTRAKICKQPIAEKLKKEEEFLKAIKERNEWLKNEWSRKAKKKSLNKYPNV